MRIEATNRSLNVGVRPSKGADNSEPFAGWRSALKRQDNRAKSKTARQQQAMATKNKILEKGWELLHKKGFDNITIQELTDVCGIAKGTFYLYFGTKQDLLRDLERLPYQRFLKKMDRLADRSLVEKLTCYIKQWFAVRKELGLNIMRSWMSYYVQGSADAAAGNDADSKMEYDIGTIASYFDEAVRTGELRPDTPVELLTHTIIFAIFGSSMFSCRNQEKFEAMDWETKFTELVADWIAPYQVAPPPGAPRRAAGDGRPDHAGKRRKRGE